MTARRARAWLGALILGLVLAGPQQARGQDRAPEGQDAVDHDIKLAERDEARVGEERILSLTIAPRPGHTISREGPLLITLAAAPAGALVLPRPRYQHGDAADARADAPRFDLRYRAAQPGQHVLHVSLAFWVCGAHVCWPVRSARRVAVHVAAP